MFYYRFICKINYLIIFCVIITTFDNYLENRPIYRFHFLKYVIIICLAAATQILRRNHYLQRSQVIKKKLVEFDISMVLRVF